ncbi:hypothetical protein AB0F73_21360, partial [Micromonospora purpureochromogenes]
MSVRPLGATPAARRVAVLAVLAALALACGGYGLVRADAGLTTRRATVDGVPLTEVRAAGVAAHRRAEPDRARRPRHRLRHHGVGPPPGLGP